MTQKRLTADTVSSLAQKLDEFSEVLTKEEQALLLGLLGTASATIDAGHSEAEGVTASADNAFVSMPTNVQLPKLSETLKETFRNIPGMGSPGDVMDSVGVGWLCVSWSKDYSKENIADKVTNPALTTRIQGMKTYR